METELAMVPSRPIRSPGETPLRRGLTLSEQFVPLYGVDAEFEAAKQADAIIERGDPEGLAVWKRILRSVDELLSTEKPPGSKLQ